MHQKTVQHYWVNTDDNQATGRGGPGGVSYTQRQVNLAKGGGSESTHVSDTGAGAASVRKHDWQAHNATHRRG